MRLVVGKRGLAVAVALSIVLMSVWMWWVEAHSGLQFSVVPPNTPVTTSDTATYELLDLTTSDSVVSSWGTTLTPDPGAVFVTARVHFDLRTVPPGKGGCFSFLHGGKKKWNSQSFSPKAPAVDRCEAGKAGVVVTLFQVPQSMVPDIDGVLLRAAEGWVLLSGRAS